MNSILTITLSPTVDISGEAETVRPTRKTRMPPLRYEPGGGGINVARVISMFGGDVEALYFSGGELGSLLDRLVRESGIRHRRFAISGQTRLAFMVNERTTGLQYRFVPEGPEIRPDELQPCFDAIEKTSCRYVVASGSLAGGAPDDTFVRLAKSAAARGIPFVLDTSGAALKRTLSEGSVHLVKPSRGELESLAGHKLDEDGAGRLASDLVARGSARFVAVTMGADGALLASASGIKRLPAIHVRVRSAVGAGDSFLGAMVWALSEGESPEQAFRLGMAAGAATAMTPGTELCRHSDVYQLLQANMPR